MSPDVVAWLGILMLLSVCVLTLTTRWAIWEILVCVSTVFSVLGLINGTFSLALLGLLSSRLLGLLENDLLQAIPLYVLFGLLLQASGLSQDIFTLLKRICWRLHLPQQTAVLLFSALIAPMNGSVAANARLLKKLLTGNSLLPEHTDSLSLVSVSSTVGLVIPPSLVLILMGDAMMRAHTEAYNSGLWMTNTQHVMNTADMFNTAIVPGLVIFVLWLVISVLVFRKTSREESLSSLQAPAATLVRAWVAIGFIVLMLVNVFNGVMYAVEAAATGCLALLIYTALQPSSNPKKWLEVLKDTFAFSGSLLTLLVAATTFSLVIRLFETDQWISRWIVGAPTDTFHTFMVLLGVGACAWLMDAFELIFVVIPVVSPGLMVHLGSAEKAAELLLLVIQLSYLVPPFGYAVVIASQSASSVNKRQLLNSLLPYWLVLLLVFAWVFLRSP